MIKPPRVGKERFIDKRISYLSWDDFDNQSGPFGIRPWEEMKCIVQEESKNSEIDVHL